MRKHWILFLLFIFTINTYAASTPPTSLAPMLQKILPAIVNIKAERKGTAFIANPGGQGGQIVPIPGNVTSAGSGVIVDAKNGYILTNAHVIDDALTVMVTLSDTRHYYAKVIGSDKASDVALIAIKAKNLTAVPIGDSNLLKVGDTVAAIGNPFGLSQTVTSGIVSALGRTTLGIESLENFIQTDAPINTGNSGGALVNEAGQLIGINTAILAPNRGSGIGFAIPSSIAKSVMMQLLEYGNVRRGALGIGVQDVTPQLSEAFHSNLTQGAVITLIMTNSPASHAGLQTGDIITRINDTNIKNANDVINSIAFLRVDSKANISVVRNNKAISLSTIITDPEKRKKSNEEKDPFLYGLALKDFTLSSPMHGNIQGILIVNVDQNSNAWQADIRPGDVIISANQQKVTTIDELKAAANKAQNTFLINVLRDAGAMFLVIYKENS
jgi:serine protease Do